MQALFWKVTRFYTLPAWLIFFAFILVPFFQPKFTWRVQVAGLDLDEYRVENNIVTSGLSENPAWMLDVRLIDGGERCQVITLNEADTIYVPVPLLAKKDIINDSAILFDCFIMFAFFVSFLHAGWNVLYYFLKKQYFEAFSEFSASLFLCVIVVMGMMISGPLMSEESFCFVHGLKIQAEITNIEVSGLCWMYVSTSLVILALTLMAGRVSAILNPQD